MWKCFVTAAGAVALAASSLAAPATAAVEDPSAPSLSAVDNAREARPGEAATVDGQSLAAVSAAARAVVDSYLARRGMKGDPKHYNCDWQKDVLSGKLGGSTAVWWDAYQFHYWCQQEADEHGRLPFASPSVTRLAYNLEGDHTGCYQVSGKFEHLNGNLYFWRPYDGRNFNPGKFTVPCDESTRNSEAQFYKREDVPRFYMGPEDKDGYHKSYWKINVEKVRTGLNRDESKSKAFTPSTW